VIVRKLFGENPVTVMVNQERAEFDAEGVAEVSEEAAKTFSQIPGYEVEGVKQADKPEEEKPAEDDKPEEEKPAEDDKPEEEAPAAPKRKAPRKAAPKKA
jgi:hypothetical protein